MRGKDKFGIKKKNRKNDKKYIGKEILLAKSLQASPVAGVHCRRQIAQGRKSFVGKQGKHADNKAPGRPRRFESRKAGEKVRRIERTNILCIRARNFVNATRFISRGRDILLCDFLPLACSSANFLRDADESRNKANAKFLIINGYIIPLILFILFS